MSFLFGVAQVVWPLASTNSRSMRWAPAPAPWATASPPCPSPSSRTIPLPRTSSRSSAGKARLWKTPWTWTPLKSGSWRNSPMSLSCGELSWVCALCPRTKGWKIPVEAQLFPSVLWFGLCHCLVITLILPCPAKLSPFLEDLHGINELQLLVCRKGL